MSWYEVDLHVLHKDPAQDHFRGVGFSACVGNELIKTARLPTLCRFACCLLLKGLGINAQFDLRGKSFARCLGANLCLLLELKKLKRLPWRAYGQMD